eukprot:1517984-Alexandrium_andersonii.AAC.1
MCIRDSSACASQRTTKRLQSFSLKRALAAIKHNEHSAQSATTALHKRASRSFRRPPESCGE